MTPTVSGLALGTGFANVTIFRSSAEDVTDHSLRVKNWNFVVWL